MFSNWKRAWRWLESFAFEFIFDNSLKFYQTGFQQIKYIEFLVFFYLNLVTILYFWLNLWKLKFIFDFISIFEYVVNLEWCQWCVALFSFWLSLTCCFDQVFLSQYEFPGNSCFFLRKLNYFAYFQLIKLYEFKRPKSKTIFILLYTFFINGFISKLIDPPRKLRKIFEFIFLFNNIFDTSRNIMRTLALKGKPHL